MERQKKSTVTIMLAFFTVMASFLAFIIFIPNKELIHWLSFMFILLAEFTYFIGQLFIQMLPERTSHPASLKLLLVYLIATIVLGLAFMLLRVEPTRLVTGVMFGLFAATLIGLFWLGNTGKLINPGDDE